MTMYTAVPAVWLLFAGHGAKSIGEVLATPPWAGCAKCRHNDVLQLMFPSSFRRWLRARDLNQPPIGRCQEMSCGLPLPRAMTLNEGGARASARVMSPYPLGIAGVSLGISRISPEVWSEYPYPR